MDKKEAQDIINVINILDEECHLIFLEIREELKITQVNLGKILGVTNQHIHHIENKRRIPSNALIKKLLTLYLTNKK